MEQLSEEKKQEIIRVLQERGVNRPCPRCGNKSISIAGGYTMINIQPKLEGQVIGGTRIPTIGLVCDGCYCRAGPCS